MNWDDEVHIEDPFENQKRYVSEIIYRILSGYYGENKRHITIDRSLVKEINLLLHQIVGISNSNFLLNDSEILLVVKKAKKTFLNHENLSAKLILKVINLIDEVYGLRFFKRIAEKDPKDMSDYLNIADAKFELELYDEALRIYEYIFLIRPDYKYLYVDRAQCLKALGRLDEAKNCIRKYYECVVNDDCRENEIYEMIIAGQMAYDFRMYECSILLIISALVRLKESILSAEVIKKSSEYLYIKKGETGCYLYFDRIAKVIDIIKLIDRSSPQLSFLTKKAKNLILAVREIAEF